jgi:uncharacterized membrane protein YphA (DoxX/SURF4 family)
MSAAAALRRLLAHPWLGLALRLYVGAVFVAASTYKIIYPAEFAETLASYQVAPHWSVPLLALAMPWTELVCGLMLMLGLRTKAAAAVIGALLVLFCAVILAALLRDIPIGCGCFSSLEEPLGWGTLARDLLWLAMTVQIYRFPSALQLESRLLTALQELGA